MKVFYKALAACKVAWREREALKDALFERKGKAQRLTLAALVVMLLMVVVARVTDQSRPPERVDLAAVTIVEAQQESEVQQAMLIAQEEAQHREEAVAVARALYGIRGYELSDNAKKAVIDVIMARAECSYTFPDTIPEVVYAQAQFQGNPSETSEYLESDAELAERYITARRNGGGRTVPEGCYWFVCAWHSVTVRTAWDGGNSWSVG